MPETTILLVIAGLTAVVFGGGVVTAARIMTGRKTKKSDE